jgi:EmrB/QacA subfamily drug resistance transporter
MTTTRWNSRTAALVAATLAALLTAFTGSAINIALPDIGYDFSMNAILLSWVPTSFLLAAAMFLVPIGRFADIHGRKKVFTVGTAVFTLASLLAGLAPSAAVLLVARVLQGMGGAMISGTGVAILTSVFPAEERGRVLGINVAAVYLGLSLGPSIGGVLTQHLGWRSVFLVTIPLGVVVIAFVLWLLDGEWAEARGESFDLAGSIIYALALIALMYGFSELPALQGAILIIIGIVGFVAFGAWELRSRSPVLNLNLFVNNKAFTFSNLAALIHYAAVYAVTFLLSLYLQYIKALTPEQAGFILIFQPVIQFVFSPAAGRLSDRIEPRILASLGMMMTASGLFMLIFLGSGTPVWLIIAVLILLGLGYALFSSPNMNAIMGSVERKSYGVASGTLATMRLIGQMLSMGIATILFALFLGRVEITPELYPLFLSSAKTAFAVFTVLCVIGIFFSLARGDIRHENESDKGS